MKYDITFITEFTQEEADLLWAQGVDMDDWDYCLIFPPDILQERREMEEETQWNWFDHVKPEDRVWPKEQLGENVWRSLPPPYDKGDYVKRQVERPYWSCEDYAIGRLLTGSRSNRWYLIEWNGQKKAIGVAYHG